MKSIPSVALAAGVGAIITLTATVQAATVLNYNPLQTATGRADANVTIGNLFQVTEAGGIQITHLGVQDTNNTLGNVGGADGFFTSPIAVGLWSADGSTLLASANVGSADTIIGSYRYVALSSPITITFGTQFLLGARVGGGIEFFLDNAFGPAPFSANSGITILENRFGSGIPLTAPTTSDVGTGATVGRWGAANAQFTVIPEPSSALLGGMGVLLLLRRRRA